MTEQLKNDQAREQVAYADVVLINKTDLAPAETVESLSRLVRSLNPLARIYPIQWGDVDVDRLLRVRAFDLRNALRLDPELLTDSAHQHDADIGCVSVRVHGAIDAGRFTRWLNQLVQSRGRDLLRIKGIVDLGGEPRRYVFHGVHMTLDGRPGKPWMPGETRLNDLMFIGRRLDSAALERGFNECFMAALPGAP